MVQHLLLFGTRCRGRSPETSFSTSKQYSLSADHRRNCLLTTTLRFIVGSSGSFPPAGECACCFGVPMCKQATVSQNDVSRSIKRIAARTRWSVQGSRCTGTNVAPKHDISSLTAPANGIYIYEVRLRNIDPVPSSLASAQSVTFWASLYGSNHLVIVCTSKVPRRNGNRSDQPANVIVNGVSAPCEGHATSVRMPSPLAEQIMKLSDDTGYIKKPGRQVTRNRET